MQVSTMQGAAGVWRSLRRKGSNDLSDEALRAAFDGIDLDKSGTVEKEELRKAIMEANPLATEKVVQEMLRFADTDGDGTVDFEEYKAIMRSGADQPQG